MDEYPPHFPIQSELPSLSSYSYSTCLLPSGSLPPPGHSLLPSPSPSPFNPSHQYLSWGRLPFSSFYFSHPSSLNVFFHHHHSHHVFIVLLRVLSLVPMDSFLQQMVYPVSVYADFIPVRWTPFPPPSLPSPLSLPNALSRLGLFFSLFTRPSICLFHPFPPQ